MVVDGPMNRPAFRAYVQQGLVLALRAGDVVILDNLPAHKGREVRRAIAAVRAKLLDRPPDRPDVNPIENAFAKLKALLRKAAERTLRVSGPPSAASLTLSHLANAPTPSQLPDTIRIRPKML